MEFYYLYYLYYYYFYHYCYYFVFFQRWCQAYRNDDFVAAVNTNNGIEHQNESLKYDYLTGYKNCSLSEMLTVLITQFIPDSYRK